MSDHKDTVQSALQALHDLEDEMNDPDAWGPPVEADRAKAIERVKELQRRLREERDNLPHGL